MAETIVTVAAGQDVPAALDKLTHFCRDWHESRLLRNCVRAAYTDAG